MASTYLSRTMGTPTSRKKFTISVWVKKSKSGSSNAQHIWNGYYSTDNRLVIYFQASGEDTLGLYNVTGGSATAFILTNRKFRDTNGWYHIYYAVDTTQSTASDRIKLYINGVQETSLSQNTYPSQNADLGYANGYTNFIGKYGGDTSSQFDGAMSHFYYVDGSVIDIAQFGSTDSTTGEWKINTSPTISSYGTNGFLILKDGNTITDQSPNSNNFTVGAGTLTKTEDNPSNVFATLNPLVNLGTTSRTITNGNTKFNTSTSAWGNILSTLAFSSGKFYAEFEFTTLRASSGYGGMGITDASENYDANDNLVNNTAFSAGVRGDYRSGQSALVSAASVVSSNIGNFSNGDIIGLAADMDNKALYVHLNGTYYQVGGVTGVPTSGSSKTGALTIPATCVDCMFFAASYTVDAVITANFGNGYFGTTAVSSAGTNASGNGIFEYDVPTGYTALSTKGLNL